MSPVGLLKYRVLYREVIFEEELHLPDDQMTNELPDDQLKFRYIKACINIQAFIDNHTLLKKIS